MDQHLSLVTLGVSDLDRSQAFYERLGWRRAMRDAEGVAFFQLNGMALSLYPLDDLAADTTTPAAPPGLGFPRFALALNTRTRAEVDEVLAEAARAGGTLVKPGQDAFWGGYSGYFADPDGFLWEIAWNPGFAMAEDGAITLPA